jgi:outer membrane lipoprotein-sorting protein
MNYFHKIVIFFVSFIALSQCVISQEATELTREMFSAVYTIKTLKYTCESNERINGKLKYESSDFKIQVTPFKIYVYRNTPDKGIECLYATGENNNQAKVNPNTFPWVSLNLNPHGDLVLQNRHHSIFDAGFGYTTTLLQTLMNKYSAQLKNLLEYKGEENVAGVKCHHLVFTNPAYKLTLYTVTEVNETPQTIAKKLGINFYMIMENNSGYKPSSVIKPGTRLIVPNDYASKMELYIHKDKKYPVYIKVYDTKGLYEEFKFLKVEINAALTELDFSAKNPKYHF